MKICFYALEDYEKQRRSGNNPVFRASSIGIDSDTAECWK